MPQYTVRNLKTKKEKTMDMTISESIQWEKDNPGWEVACGAPIPGYNVYSIKPDNHFVNKLKSIKKANPGSGMNIPGLGEV
jgi:hypothetical protein